MTRTHSGFSLFEVFLTVGLTSLLMMQLFTLFIKIQHQFTLQESLISMQEKMHFFSFYFMKHLPMVGDAHCVMGKLVDRRDAVGARYDPLMQSDQFWIRQCLWYHQAMRWVKVNYFVADTHRSQSSGQPVLALYRRIEGGEREELIAGVTKLRLHFGIALEGDSITAYQLATDPINSAWVRSVEIEATFAPALIVPPGQISVYVRLRE